MAKKKRTLSPEEAEWEATREERDRWVFRHMNERWRQIKAAAEARERAEREAKERAERRRALLRRFLPFIR